GFSGQSAALPEFSRSTRIAIWEAASDLVNRFLQAAARWSGFPRDGVRRMATCRRSGAALACCYTETGSRLYLSISAAVSTHGQYPEPGLDYVLSRSSLVP